MMDTEHRLVLQMNHDFLINHLDVTLVVSKLYEKLIIRDDDKERIELQLTNGDKVNTLLKILKKKTNEAFDIFLMSVDSHIREKLEKTEVPKVILERDSQELEEFMKDLLLKEYEEENNEKISVATLEEDLKRKFLYASKEYNFDVVRLKDLVLRLFPTAQYQQKSKRFKTPTFKNLRRVHHELSEETEEKSEDSSSDEERFEQETQEGSESGEVVIDDMNISDLCDVLTPLLKENDFDLEILKIIRDEVINGEIFKALSMEDTSLLFPGLKFGRRKKLLLIRDKICEDKSSTSTKRKQQQCPTTAIRALPFRETFRRFDKSAGHLDTYKQSRVLNTSITRPHNLIEPIHLFMNPDGTSQKKINKWLATATVRFSCACMNERTNGTIHFGINDRTTKTYKEGEIIGIEIDKEKCKEEIQNTIFSSFYDDQLNIVLKCIRTPQFIDVITDRRENKLSVVEVDVVPQADVLDEDAIFVKTPKRALYRLVEGSNKYQQILDEKMHEYMKINKRLAVQRKTEENKPKHIEIKTDLRQKFLNLFCGGSEIQNEETYTILFQSPIDSNTNITDDFEFVKVIDPCVVFDFDSCSEEKGLYHFIEENQEQIVKALTTDNFDKNSEENKKSPDSYNHVLDDLKISSFKPWIFCNGYDIMNKEPMDVFKWKQYRSEGFKEAVRFFCSEIPRGRAKVIILLFSKNYEVMLDAAEEILVKFQDQWILFAESRSIADPWLAELLRRKSIDDNGIKRQCIIGLPWSHVNQMIHQVMMPITRNSRCEIPCSSGAFCFMKEKTRNELCDLEIVGKNECDDGIFENDRHGLEKHRKEVQETFFRGGQVSWWNFCFGDDHVLHRSQHERLRSLVQSALEGRLTSDENKVAVVKLIHQPGAGGTTSARQIIWDMRTKCRCCVVRHITDQTSDQIAALRIFEDSESPNPPIVLIDNYEEENAESLFWNLEQRARMTERKNEEPIRTFCVLLLCSRRTNVPSKVGDETIVLKQELDKKELEWLTRKYEALEKKFQGNEGVDPRLLISFNILKENFNSDYIKRTVQQYVDDIQVKQEKDLLLYLSLVNTYDLGFNSVPVSAFDGLMSPTPGLRHAGKKTFSFGLVSPRRQTANKQWESQISSALQVLLNRTPRTTRTAFNANLKALTIINPLFSREILQYILGQIQMTINQAMLKFMKSEVFENSNKSVDALMNIVKDIFKKREMLSNGRKEKFSPFITEILEVDPDSAAEIMIEAFTTFNDPMIAQQIARLYIHCQNWENAFKYANIATQLKPQNSYLWDTFGLVYKHQLLEQFSSCARNGDILTTQETRDMVKIAVDGINKFHKEQQVSQEEKGVLNDAGFFNEVRLVILLLRLLEFAPIDKTSLHQLFVNKSNQNTYLDELGEETKEHLSNLPKFADTAMRELEEQVSQLKDAACHTAICDKPSTRHQWMLTEMRENIDHYFGEETDEVPKHLNPKDQADFRRRRVRRLRGNTLSSILSLRREDDGVDKLNMIYRHVSKNITSNQSDSNDIRTLIGVLISLDIMTKEAPLPFSVLIDNSKRLYERECENTEIRQSLEHFLYLVMFHWPTEYKKDESLFPVGGLKDVMKKWKAAFNRNHPRQQGGSFRRREATYFFLGRQKDYGQIVYYEQLHKISTGRYERIDNVWEKPKTHRMLERLKGILINDGSEVEIQFETKGGNKTMLSIPTGMPIGQRSLWQKKVYFYVGFTWSGPKAFDVSKDPRESDACLNTPKRKSNEARNGNGNQLPSIKTPVDVTHRIKKIHFKLKELKEKPDNEDNRRKIKQQEELLEGLIRQFQELLAN